MKRHSQHAVGRSLQSARPGRPPRRGILVITIVVFISLSLTFFGLWTKSLIRQRDRLSLQLFRIQADRLAEAGLERARGRRAADAAYNEETWSVPAAELDNTHAAQVKIQVTALPNNTGVRYEATAEFPTGAVRHAQRTKKIETPNSGALKPS